MVLNLNPNLIASQAAGRVAHEGGVEGPSAKRISFSMSAQLRKNGPPTKAEGFQSIIVSTCPLTFSCNLFTSSSGCTIDVQALAGTILQDPQLAPRYVYCWRLELILLRGRYVRITRT